MAPSSTKKQLRERWNADVGSKVREALFHALTNHPSRDQLRQILAPLPMSSEIPSGLDLRGVRELPFFSQLDLSDASLDYASMHGPVMGCDLSRASMVEFDAHGLPVQSRFCGARLERANLSNTRLKGEDLSGANLAKAKLVSASMSDVNLVGAKLTDADLRFAVLGGANLADADLTGAKLIEAALGGVRWNEGTIVRGADLTGAPMDDRFAAFARGAGARVSESEGAYEVAELDATVAVLRERNGDGHLSEVIKRIESVREQVATDPNFDWGAVLVREFGRETFQEVEDALQEGTMALGEYT